MLRNLLIAGLTSLIWIVAYWKMRNRYRKLLGEAIDILRDAIQTRRKYSLGRDAIDTLEKLEKIIKPRLKGKTQ